MTRKQINLMREVRLWVTTLVLPTIGIALSIPESREAIKNKIKSVCKN